MSLSKSLLRSWLLLWLLALALASYGLDLAHRSVQLLASLTHTFRSRTSSRQDQQMEQALDPESLDELTEDDLKEIWMELMSTPDLKQHISYHLEHCYSLSHVNPSHNELPRQ